MKAKLIPLILCGMALVLTGCVATLDGKNRVGMPFLSDTIERRYERPIEPVVEATRDALKFNGVIEVENVITKNFVARVDTRTVYVLVEALNPNLTRVVVQVRTKGGGADKDLGAHLMEQVAVRLATGNLSPATSPIRPPK